MEKLIDTPAGARVFRSRTEAIIRGESPAIVVRPLSEAVAEQLSQRAHRRLQVILEIVSRGDVPDSTADETIVDAHAKLMADQRLGGLCEYIEEQGTEWQMASGDLDIAVALIGYEVEYRTSIQDLTIYA
ncbi:MAG: hypothetical protein ACHBMF_03745 [Chromatiales bacterium]